MWTHVILLPGALEPEGEAPLFDPVPSPLRQWMERGRLLRVGRGNDERAWMGLGPETPPISAGVLAVSALGAEPPARSTHFCLSVLSAQGGHLSIPSTLPTEEEERALAAALARLETARLKPVLGNGLEHALVWEDGSIELQCYPPTEATGKSLRESLPEGDGEPMLRRFIDDSVNLLSETEWNRIREDENLPALNVFWPWGPGFRPKLPNLALSRGVVVRWESPSLALAGLCRMVGYRHGPYREVGAGTNLRLEKMVSSALSHPYGVIVIPTIGEFLQEGKPEEAAWLAREVFDRVFEPVSRATSAEPRRVVLVATQPGGEGLAVDFRSDGLVHGSNRPFSAEVLEDRTLAANALFELMAEVLTA